MLIVKKYLCFKLTTAALIIGWLDLISSIISIIGLIFNSAEYYGANSSVYITAISLSVAIDTIVIITSLLLIFGTNKKNHRMILPWLIFNGFTLFIFTGACIALTIYMIAIKCEILAIIGVIAITLLFIFFGFYTWSAMYSLYRIFKDQPIITDTQNILYENFDKNNPPSYSI